MVFFPLASLSAFSSHSSNALPVGLCLTSQISPMHAMYDPLLLIADPFHYSNPFQFCFPSPNLSSLPRVYHTGCDGITSHQVKNSRLRVTRNWATPTAYWRWAPRSAVLGPLLRPPRPARNIASPRQSARPRCGSRHSNRGPQIVENIPNPGRLKPKNDEQNISKYQVKKKHFTSCLRPIQLEKRLQCHNLSTSSRTSQGSLQWSFELSLTRRWKAAPDTAGHVNTCNKLLTIPKFRVSMLNFMSMSPCPTCMAKNKALVAPTVTATWKKNAKAIVLTAVLSDAWQSAKLLSFVDAKLPPSSHPKADPNGHCSARPRPAAKKEVGIAHTKHNMA